MEFFGTASIHGSVMERITSEPALRADHAAGRAALESDVSVEFVVGYDGRTTGQGSAAVVEAGLLPAGVDVTWVGVVSTLALVFAPCGRHGVVLTASHNPPTDNGTKMFVGGQEYDRDLERDIETRVEADVPPTDWDDWGATGTSGVLDVHCDAIVEFVGQHGVDFDSLSVAVDYGNEMSALDTSQVLRDLGARVVTLNGWIDGHLPGRESEPMLEVPADPIAFVADGDFDFGIGYDGDADCAVIIGGDGEVVYEDTVTAMVVEHYVRASGAENPAVVTMPNTSDRIDERAREAGDHVERICLDVPHEGIASARADGGDAVSAAELWKHVHPSLSGRIDGVASVALVTCFTAESGMAGLCESVTERPYRRVSVPRLDENRRAVTVALETLLPEAMAPESVNIEYGVRLELADVSQTLVRLPGTEPYIQVHSEVDDVDAFVDEVTTVVEGEVEATWAESWGNRPGRVTRRNANTTLADVNRRPVLGDLQMW